MFNDLKRYFALLAQYLRSKWTRVIVGVLVGMVAQVCALISPLLTRYLIDVVITQKHYSLLNNILVLAGIVLATLLAQTFLLMPNDGLRSSGKPGEGGEQEREGRSTGDQIWTKRGEGVY